MSKGLRNTLIVVVLLICVPLADFGYGLYSYSSARQECNYHMMYNIPGRGRLTDDPYSSEEINLIGLDCRAYGLDAQLANVRLPFNRTRASNQLVQARENCAAVTDYDFAWGCD